jgi:hypothetical protein
MDLLERELSHLCKLTARRHTSYVYSMSEEIERERERKRERDRERKRERDREREKVRTNTQCKQDLGIVAQVFPRGANVAVSRQILFVTPPGRPRKTC